MRSKSLTARAVSRPCVSLAKISAAIATLLALAFTLTAVAQKQVEQQPPGEISPEQAAREGRDLIAEILSQKPSQNTTNTGVMTIRRKNTRTQIPISFEVFSTPTNWVSVYFTPGADRSHFAHLTVLHTGGQPNRYLVASVNAPGGTNSFNELHGPQLFSPFVDHSDFWIADLGLEFFHWPGQRVIKKEMKRSRSCQVLESINPNPQPGSYSRVLSWIDNESDGIVMAQAYDAQGKLLKEFIPKKVEKINGQWQLQEMEIDNDQSDSNTRVDFDLNK